MSVLALDVSGIPRTWVSFDEAIKYHAANAVVWSLGEVVARYRGGTQNDGTVSYLETTSIIAVRGTGFDLNKHSKVTLSNRSLFGRDRMMCCYCKQVFPNFRDLTRDHIVPVSKGGDDTWLNCVASCQACNSKKGNKLLSETDLELAYLPYVPNYWEQLILQGRNILSDQMEYLLKGVPKQSRLTNVT